MALSQDSRLKQVTGAKAVSMLSLWKEMAEHTINWIWAQRAEAGLWDLGNKTGRKSYSSFPHSETWQRAENRVMIAR